jgi:hypothetical protein
MREDYQMSPAQEHLKVHRRTLRLDGLDYTILTPRPSSEARFATNRFHETWHVLSDAEGARLFARLCWAMAFQRRRHTVMVIDAPLVVSNPFDADPSSPIAIVNSDLGPFGRGAAAALRSSLPFRLASSGTVALQTRGLDVALEDPKAFARRDDQAHWHTHRTRRWFDGSAGVLMLSAPSAVLKTWGVEVSELGTRSSEGSSWSYLDYPEKEGEVQVLDNFSSHVERAISARSHLFPGREQEQLPDEDKRRIWSSLGADAERDDPARHP